MELARYWVAVALLAGSAVMLHLVSHGEPVEIRQPLAELPSTLGAWQGRELPIEKRIIDAVGVDDYLSRVYYGKDGEPMLLYIGYYKTQRTGRTIHSPKNCLPGAGWQPVRAGRTEVTLPDGSKAQVNLYIIEKGLTRQMVFYWYQSHGRIIASEYWAKIYMVLDALRLNRTDSALVRVSTTLDTGEPMAQARLLDFSKLLLANTQDLSPR